MTLPALRRIAVLWSRFGPYHVARLKAAAKLGAAAGIDVAGIEVAPADATYAWDAVGPCEGFARVTLFPRARYETVSRAVLSAVLLRELERLAPDAVAINGWSATEAQTALAWAARRGRIAIVMSESKADDSPRVWWKERTKQLLLGACDAALVGGERHGDYLALLGFPRTRIVTGYDVVDNAYFRAGAAAARARAREARSALGLPERYFLACTRFLPRKNVDGLLKAYARYRAETKRAPWGLVIAGSGPEWARLGALERALGVDGVVWPGFVQYDRLPLYYGLASAFVHAAVSEPWGLVVNEAVASGLPVLVSRTTGAAHELVADGVNGTLFEPLDPGDAARAMRWVAESSARERKEMGQYARATAKQWGPERFGAGLLAAAALGKRTSGARRAA